MDAGSIPAASTSISFLYFQKNPVNIAVARYLPAFSMFDFACLFVVPHRVFSVSSRQDKKLLNTARNLGLKPSSDQAVSEWLLAALFVSGLVNRLIILALPQEESHYSV
ncbi:MAG TPA: hypothetical protein VK400_11640 [Pyrinomonadaceae bacterium]|nr:hypothetical protein [Pyrinomonadaceae bacterium]